MPYKSIGSGILTVSSTPVGFASGSLVPNPSRPPELARCYVEGASIRVRTSDGPTSGLAGGEKISDGETFTIEGANDVLSFMAIRDGDVDAIINYELYEER